VWSETYEAAEGAPAPFAALKGLVLPMPLKCSIASYLITWRICSNTASGACLDEPVRPGEGLTDRGVRELHQACSLAAWKRFVVRWQNR
jgi:hypothetical protein